MPDCIVSLSSVGLLAAVDRAVVTPQGWFIGCSGQGSRHSPGLVYWLQRTGQSSLPRVGLLAAEDRAVVTPQGWFIGSNGTGLSTLPRTGLLTTAEQISLHTPGLVYWLQWTG